MILIDLQSITQSHNKFPNAKPRPNLSKIGVATESNHTENVGLCLTLTPTLIGIDDNFFDLGGDSILNIQARFFSLPQDQQRSAINLSNEQNNLPQQAAETILQQVRKTLRSTPQQGIGYGMLRYNSTDPLPLAPNGEILSHYLGQTDRWLASSGLKSREHHITLSRPAHAERPYLTVRQRFSISQT